MTAPVTPPAQPQWQPGATGKILALDMGLARIGVAVCDPLRLAARPLTVVQRSRRNADFAQIARLFDEQEAVAVLCGLPLNMDGSEGDQARTTRKWAMRLAQALRALLGRPVPVVLWDERLSSYAAQEIIATHGLDVPEDAAAAAVILQSFLDALKAGVPVTDVILLPPRGVDDLAPDALAPNAALPSALKSEESPA
jgi:putative Holliday junction resolvase